MANERKFITENIRRVLLKEYLMKEVSRAGFGGMDVQRTPMGTRITLVTERPGIVIGRRGSAIKSLTRSIEDIFDFDNPQVEVQEVENANLNAQIMAEKLAFALERGWHFRRAGHSTIRRVMESGARGCHIVVAGKLTGQRHRTEKFKDGYIKFCGEPKIRNIDRGYAVAKLKPGVVGVTVEIMHPEATLPDEVDVTLPAEAAEQFPELAPLINKKEEPIVAVETKDKAEESEEPDTTEATEDPEEPETPEATEATEDPEEPETPEEPVDEAPADDPEGEQ
ncbi:MAG: 30S ribosomal protein S3 [Euryarchaeota archaeon]|nr:30S ribosomal protein S3 [Euryarchaeota archaeon]